MLNKIIKSGLFIYTGTGTIGDFITNIDLAEKFFVATNKTVIFFTLKKSKGFVFCEEMSKKYNFISIVSIINPIGLFSFIFFYIKSFFVKCYMHIIIDDPLSIKLKNFINFIINFSKINLSLYNIANENLYFNNLTVRQKIHTRYDTFHYFLLKDFYKIDVKNINEKSNKIPTTYFCDNELLGKKYIVIAVLASLQSKSRTVEQWVESLYTLFIYFPSHLFVFVGSNDANNYFNNIQKNFKPDEKDKFINRIGCYNFNELCSTITNADLFIGLQSGLSHIAFRQNIPSILFSAEVQKYFEISRINFINLLSLKRCKCKEHDFHYCNKDFFACTRDVKNDEFVNAIKKILSL